MDHFKREFIRLVRRSFRIGTIEGHEAGWVDISKGERMFGVLRGRRWKPTSSPSSATAASFSSATPPHSSTPRPKHKPLAGVGGSRGPQGSKPAGGTAKQTQPSPDKESDMLIPVMALGAIGAGAIGTYYYFNSGDTGGKPKDGDDSFYNTEVYEDKKSHVLVDPYGVGEEERHAGDGPVDSEQTVSEQVTSVEQKHAKDAGESIKLASEHNIHQQQEKEHNSKQKEDAIQQHPDERESSLTEEKHHRTDDEQTIILDSHDILGSIEAVLTKSGEQMVREDEDKLAKKDDQQKKEDETQREKDAERMALAMAMSDSAGDAVVNEIADGEKKSIQQQDSVAKSKQKKEDAVASVAPVSTVARGLPEELAVLGIQEDISAAGLISQAVAHGMEDDWEGFHARHRQAESDAKAILQILTRASVTVKQQVTALEEEINELEHEKERLEGMVVAEADNFKKKMHETLSNIERMQNELLQAQAASLAITHEKELTRERVKRQEAVDAVRLQLDSLSDALRQQTIRAKSAQESHKISTTVFALKTAVEKGEDFGDLVQHLKNTYSDEDPVIAVAIDSMEKVSKCHIKTREQIVAEFEEVKPVLKELAYLPKGRGGMISALAAKLAAKIKIEENAGSSPENTVDSLIAYAKEHVVDGKLIETTEILSERLEDTAAAYALQDWVRDVHHMCIAEQAISILESYVTCISFTKI